jgi:hypothetical protein
MASPSHAAHVDLERLLASCGYTIATAQRLRRLLWKGCRLVSRDDAIGKLTAFLESKPRRRLVQLKGAQALEALKGAPKGARCPDGPVRANADDALAKALASLAGLADASLRMSPDNLPSLVDTVAMLAGKSQIRSAECVNNIVRKYFRSETLAEKITHYVLDGCEQSPTPFPRSLEALVEFVLIPGRKAAHGDQQPHPTISHPTISHHLMCPQNRRACAFLPHHLRHLSPRPRRAR